MRAYIDRLFRPIRQLSKDVVVPLPAGTYEESLQRLDVPLYNKRLDLLKYLVENNAEDSLGDEINALLTALLEQLQVKVFEPPDDDIEEFDIEYNYTTQKVGE